MNCLQSGGDQPRHWWSQWFHIKYYCAVCDEMLNVPFPVSVPGEVVYICGKCIQIPQWWKKRCEK